MRLSKRFFALCSSCLVNSLVRNKECMCRVWGREDLMCDYGPETGECTGVEQTVAHLYQTCGRVSEAWSWLFNFITAGVLGVPPPQYLSSLLT